MPHVELKGPFTTRALHESFEPASERLGDAVFKTSASYLRKDAAEILIEALVVEGYLKQEFLVQVRDRDGGLLIRLFPATPVQRTEGVKRFIVWLARRFQAASPGLVMGTTNLQAYIDPRRGA
jgi:hypothetical protein